MCVFYSYGRTLIQMAISSLTILITKTQVGRVAPHVKNSDIAVTFEFEVKTSE